MVGRASKFLKKKPIFSKSANFSAFSHITERFVRQILLKLPALGFFKTGPFLHSNIAYVCRFYFSFTQNKRERKDQYSGRRGE